MTETGHTERVVMPAEFWGGPADGWVGGALEPVPSVLTFPFTQARAGATFAPDSRVPLGSGRYELVTSSAGDPIRYVLGRIRYVHRVAP